MDDFLFRVQKISNYGTATPAIARTFAQGCDVLRWFNCPSEQIEQAKKILLELQRHVLKCFEQQDLLAADIQSALRDVDELRALQSPEAESLILPGVGDLHRRAETFLQSAKLAVASTGELTRPFYGKGFGHNYRRFARWTEEQFGVDDEFNKVVQSWEPFARRVGDMRNAVDHPMDVPGGRLVTKNFEVSIDEGGTPTLVEPLWGLSDEPLEPILPSFQGATERLIVLGEVVLAHLFYKLKKPLPVVLRDIPEGDRNPSNPKRLEIILARP